MESFSLEDSSHAPLDHKLDALMNHKRNGFYIEMGAFDGLYQSNTAFFEKYREWKGILIEPSPNMYKKCVINRPNSNCFNCACVSADYIGNTISGDFTGGMMSSVEGLRTNATNLVNVKADTLTNICDSVKPTQIDLLSLDVEGYERNVLDGLDFNKYRPKYMLIEVYTKDYDEIVQFLTEKGYALHSNFSNYSKKTNPGWDGTHNDYLFVDIKPDA